MGNSCGCCCDDTERRLLDCCRWCSVSVVIRPFVHITINSSASISRLAFSTKNLGSFWLWARVIETAVSIGEISGMFGVTQSTSDLPFMVGFWVVIATWRVISGCACCRVPSHQQVGSHLRLLVHHPVEGFRSTGIFEGSIIGRIHGSDCVHAPLRFIPCLRDSYHQVLLYFSRIGSRFRGWMCWLESLPGLSGVGIYTKVSRAIFLHVVGPFSLTYVL